MNFGNIPAELRELDQWVVWRLELREGAKPTKVPYAPRPGGTKASVTDRATWGSYADAIRAPFTCKEPCDPLLPVAQTGFSGIGFVFTDDDPYGFIDLDDTHGDAEAFAVQMKVFGEFNSYSELSPSGTGLHIIIKGKLPHGRRRADIEVYTSERYATMTGNVHWPAPIAERQDKLDILFEEMGGEKNEDFSFAEKPQEKSDEDIVGIALSAMNGDKFNTLYNGNWSGQYSSQSEADFALVDIIAFYTQNSAQIARIFRQSALGQRDKAQRDDYLGYMIRKSFDRQLPPVNLDNVFNAIMASRAAANGATAEPGGTAAAPNPTGPEPRCRADDGVPSITGAVNPFPPGLLGQIAQFLLDASPRPVADAGLAGSIALMSAICGRAFNVSGQGLNQYMLYLAKTGDGKDAIHTGIGRLMGEVAKNVPAAGDFRGPGELVSSAGLIKWLDRKPAVLSLLGEFGVKLKEMASPYANAHVAGLERVLLQLYSKSGRGNVFDPIAYSDKEKNTNPILSPSLTLIGESVPERFYAMLDENMISSGLIPRFLMFEYTGKRLYLNENAAAVRPSIDLIQKVGDLCGTALTLAHNGNIHDVPMDAEATKAFREFEYWTTDQINEANTENIRHLWNRAHLKALKLAAVCAVGINLHSPLITMNEFRWAVDIVVGQTERLIAKFETGLVGHLEGSENKQLTDVVSIISSYIHSPWAKMVKYGGSEEMHRMGVITEGHISRRTINLASFKHDKLGPTAALKRTLKLLLDADDLREMPKQQMQAQFGKGPRAFVVANAAHFMPETEA
jgi:hypothetical protein